MIQPYLFFGGPQEDTYSSGIRLNPPRLPVYTADQLRRHAEGALPRHEKRPRAKRRVQLRLLQGLPGIGPARAADLLERFARVEAVMTADAEFLQPVDGIGPRTAASIRWALE